MPDGVVQWFDPRSGEARIMHAGRRYAARAEDMDSRARTPGARVHFDVDTDAEGGVARAVRLRSGSRVSHRHRRFGDMAGVSTPDAKGSAVFDREQPALGPTMERNPMELVRQWCQWLSSGDLEEAMQLYAPDASLHAGGQVRVGPRDIRVHWERSELLGDRLPQEVRGDETDGILVRWTASSGGDHVSRLRIAHDEIAEQWVGRFWEERVEPTEWPEETDGGTEDGWPGTTLEVSIGGEVPDRIREDAVAKLRRVLGRANRPVQHVELRLEHWSEPRRDRPSRARAILDVNGNQLRVQVRTRSLDEAVDLLERRLLHQLESLDNRREVVERRGPDSPPGEWRHGDAPTPRPDYFPRPAEDRAIVRHKTFSTPASTLDEAVFDLETLDYDFLLFTDLASGSDALVERTDGSYRVRYLDGTPENEAATAVPVEVLRDEVATLTVGRARELLDGSDQSRVFHRDAESGRGQVLYRRYDGHYGLITPRSAVHPASGDQSSAGTKS